MGEFQIGPFTLGSETGTFDSIDYVTKDGTPVSIGEVDLFFNDQEFPPFKDAAELWFAARRNAFDSSLRQFADVFKTAADRPNAFSLDCSRQILSPTCGIGQGPYKSVDSCRYQAEGLEVPVIRYRSEACTGETRHPSEEYFIQRFFEEVPGPGTPRSQYGNCFAYIANDKLGLPLTFGVDGTSYYLTHSPLNPDTRRIFAVYRTASPLDRLLSRYFKIAGSIPSEAVPAMQILGMGQEPPPTHQQVQAQLPRSISQLNGAFASRFKRLKLDPAKEPGHYRIVFYEKRKVYNEKMEIVPKVLPVHAGLLSFDKERAVWRIENKLAYGEKVYSSDIGAAAVYFQSKRYVAGFDNELFYVIFEERPAPDFSSDGEALAARIEGAFKNEPVEPREPQFKDVPAASFDEGSFLEKNKAQGLEK